MFDKRFEGWYYKQSNGDITVAFIPGEADDGAFVQVITDSGSHIFRTEKLKIKGDTVKTGNCFFSPSGIKVRLPEIDADLRYTKTTPLRSDIMGPFAKLPMQCRHGVVSMRHTVNGTLTMYGKIYIFKNGIGYAEKDSGRSFPKSYMWVQCNEFDAPCSFMLAIAHIPFLITSFKGCICAVVYKEKEYLFATYKGVMSKIKKDRIYLKQGALELEIYLRKHNGGHPLKAPLKGQMSQTVRETTNAGIRLVLKERGKILVDCKSDRAAFELRKN